MKFSKILCPTDFSDYSLTAVELAGMLARDGDAELILLHAVDPPISYAVDAPLESQRSEAVQAARKRLDSVAIPPTSHRVRRLVVEGDAGAAILDVARDERVDLIVISTYGRSGWTRLMMGSTAEYVLRNAGCQVISLKSPEPGPAVA
jgi:nucleotide-binding universal stress UspA family protein